MATHAAPTHEALKQLDSGVLESVVAVFDNHDAAEKAVRDVQKAGLDMRKLSIIARDY